MGASKIDVDKQKGSEPRKTILQELKEKIIKVWDGFKESLGRLWGKAEEKVDKPLTEKAKEIAEKTKIDRVKDFFKTEAENFKEGIQIRGNEIQAGWNEFLAETNDVRAMFWRKFMGGKLSSWAAENQEKANERRSSAKVHHEAAEKIREKGKQIEVKK